MKIAILYWTDRRIGGAEAYLESLMQGLTELGHAIAFFHESSRESSIPKIQLPEKIPVFGPLTDSIKSTVEPLANWKPDVLISNSLFNTELERELRRLGKVIYISHNYRGMCISGGKTHTRPSPKPCNLKFGPKCLAYYFPKGCGGKNPLTAWKFFRFQKDWLQMLLASDHIVTYSGHMKTQWEKHGFPSEKITLIPPFPPKDSTNDLPIPNALPDLSDPANPLRLLFAGRMESVKGGQFLIQSAPEISQRLHRKLQIVMAGDGPDRSLWQSEANQIQSQYPNQIEFNFPGWLSGNDLWKSMDQSHLLVFPSVWPEPFGLLGIEAGLRRCPVAGFHVGGVPDWLKSGVNGYGSDPGPNPSQSLSQTIIRCAENPSHLNELRQGAAQVASEFSRSAHLKKFNHLLKKLHSKTP